MINVLFGITKPIVERLRGNLIPIDEEGVEFLYSDLTPEEKRRFRTYTHGHWKEETAGAVIWEVVSSYISSETRGGRDSTDLELVDVDTALAKFATQVYVIGAWNVDGSQYGTEITQVENGTDSIENQDRIVTPTVVGQKIDMEATIAAGEPVYVDDIQDVVTYVGNGTFTDVPHYDEVVVGTPVYPINLARAKKYMPDDVTYDADGNETSRSNAAAPKQVNKILGWKDRRWS